jgi:hypothetical protein
MTSLPEHVRTHVAFNGNLEWDALLAALDKVSPGIGYGGGDERTIINPLIKTETVETNYAKAQQGGFNGRCHYCNIPGHRIADCMKRARDRQTNSSSQFDSSTLSNNTTFSNNGRPLNRQSYQSPMGQSAQGPYQAYNGQQRSNYGGRNNVSGSMGPRSSVSLNSTQLISDQPLANSTFVDDRNDQSQVQAASSNFLQQQQTLLRQQQQFLNQQQQLQQQQQQHHQQQHHQQHHNGQLNNGGQFYAANAVSHNCTAVSEEVVDSSFPFYASSFSACAIPATLGDSNDCLLRTIVPFQFGGFEENTVALVDGGSTHSFLAPESFSESQKSYFNSIKSTLVRRLFIITSSTGSVKEFCYLLPADIKIGIWSGTSTFIVSQLVNKHRMVLGRDFLKKKKVVVDHGLDTLKIEGIIVSINSINASDEQVNEFTDGSHLDQVSENLEHLDYGVARSFPQPPVERGGDPVIGKRVHFAPDSTTIDCATDDIVSKAGGMVYSVDNVTLAPNAQTLVRVKFTEYPSSSCDVYYEPDLSSFPGCLGAKSAHKRDIKNQYCSIMNLNPDAVLLPLDTCIGTVRDCLVGERPSGCSSDATVNDGDLDAKIKHAESVSLGSNLDLSQRAKIVALLVHHYECFQWDKSKIGRTTMVEHAIDTGDARPIMQRQYPVPTIAQESLRAQVKDMLDKGFIRPSNSAWRSPVLLIKKTSDEGVVSYRFCIDLRKVNEVTLKDAYSLPRIDETVDALGGSKYFTVMDVDRAFWQVGLKEDDKKKTAFVVDGRLYEFNVMPFGCCNAPATFQRLMDKVLNGLTWHQCLVYIDDVLVFAKDFDTHLENLNLVLTRIKAAGLKLKPDKCKIADNKVEYLGFSISDKGRQPSRKKIEALMRVQPPNTSKALLSFLLSLNYYRSEIPRFGELTVDLYEMANSTRKLCVWSERLTANFKDLQTALGSAPILAFPNFDVPFIIQGDASKKAVGGACLQGNHVVFESITKVHPVSFFGRKLTLVEQRYPVIERELLALLVGYKSSYHFVYGRHVIFLTDHEPLVTLQRLKNPLGRFGRLLNQLADVSYEIKYIPGSNNHLADFMSRVEHPFDPCPVSVNSIELRSGIDWFKEQQEDKDVATIGHLIKTNATDSEWIKSIDGSAWLRNKAELYLANGILKFGSGRTVVPKHLRTKVLEWYHDAALAGHRGYEPVLASLRFRYFWLCMPTFVKEFCKSCDKCQQFNYASSISRAPMVPIFACRRNQILGVDFMGPFKKSRNGNSYIVLGVDFFSKFVEATPTVSFDALISAIFVFNVFICRHGAYEQILTDRGVNFESHLFKHLCLLMGTTKSRTTSFHAQCNGGTEVVNKVIKPCLAKLIDSNQDDWDVYLPMAVASYNNAFHTSIGMTPFEAHFGRPGSLISDIVLNHKLPAETRYHNVSDFTVALYENAKRIDAIIHSSLYQAHEKQKTAYDKTVRDVRQFNIGDHVKIVNYSHKIGQSSCFQNKFLGPYVISSINGVVYTVQDSLGKLQTLHYNRLLPYYTRSEAMSTSKEMSPVIPCLVSQESVHASSELSTLRRSSRIFAKLCAVNKAKCAQLLLQPCVGRGSPIEPFLETSMFLGEALVAGSGEVQENVDTEQVGSSVLPSVALANNDGGSGEPENESFMTGDEDDDESELNSKINANDMSVASPNSNVVGQSNGLNTSRNSRGKQTFQCIGCSIYYVGLKMHQNSCKPYKLMMAAVDPGPATI